MNRLNNILFHTTYLGVVPRPYLLLDDIIADFSLLTETQQNIYVNTVILNSNQFRTLINFLKYSKNEYRFDLIRELNRRSILA